MSQSDPALATIAEDEEKQDHAAAAAMKEQLDKWEAQREAEDADAVWFDLPPQECAKNNPPCFVYNTTPHAVTVFDEDKHQITRVPANRDHLLRVPEKEPEKIATFAVHGTLATIPVCKPPEFKPFTEDDLKLIQKMDGYNKVILASAITADVLVQKMGPTLKSTVLVSHSGPPSCVRDGNGQILGVKMVRQYHPEPSASPQKKRRVTGSSDEEAPSDNNDKAHQD